jgi:hypothetical protein
MHLTIKNVTRTPGGVCGLIMGSNGCIFLMESLQIGGFVEGLHELKSPASSGKTTDGQLASPLDCHKTAKIMSYEDASCSTYHPCIILIRNLVSNVLSKSIFIFNFNVDGIMHTST